MIYSILRISFWIAVVVWCVILISPILVVICNAIGISIALDELGGGDL